MYLNVLIYSVYDVYLQHDFYFVFHELFNVHSHQTQTLVVLALLGVEQNNPNVSS
jgi:hypothetical protein